MDEKSFTIGRSLEATIALSEPNISRIHVMVVSKHDRVWIEDQNSANGTYINGERIQTQKLVAISPLDKIRLGTANFEFSFNTLEKIFKKEDLKNSDLAKPEKESLMALVNGAHAEAQRLVKLGQENQEKLVRAAELKAQSIEQAALIKKDEIISAATNQGEQIIQACKKKGAEVIFEAEENARHSVEEIHQQAETVRRKADQHFASQTEAAQVRADEIIAQHTQLGKDMLQDAMDKAQSAAEEVKQEYLESARVQIEEESKIAYDQALAKASVEREKMIDHARLDVEKYENKRKEIARLIENLIEKKSDMESDLSEFAEKVESERESLLRAREQSIQKETEEILEELEKQNRKHEEIRKAFIRETQEQKENQTREIGLAIKTKRDELAHVTKEYNEISNKLEQRRKVFDQELALHKEITEKEAVKFYNEKKQEIELMSQRRIKEVEVYTREKKEEAELFVQSKKLEYEKFKSETEDVIKNLESERKTLVEDVSVRKKEHEKITVKLTESENRIKVVEPQFLKMKTEMQGFENQTESLKLNVKDLENKKGHLALQYNELQEKMINLKRDHEAQAAEYKSKLDQEFNRLRREHEDQVDRLQDDEDRRAQKVKEELIEELFKEKEKISKEIFTAIEIEVVKVLKPIDWSSISQPVKEKILQTLEDRTISIATHTHGDGIESISIPKKKRAERISYLLQGLVAGMLVFFVGQFGYHKFQEDSNPMKTAAEEDARKRAEDLERRKFNPPQTDELRENYADSVIYTQNFVQNYLDEEFQRKWLRSATSYLLKQWRIEEEKTIEILGAVNSLIKTLDEKKQSIHPDFIEDGIAKMNELEMNSVNHIKEMLGSDVKYQAFRRYEKRFYIKENSGRVPANESSATEE